ncbi:MAG: ADP-forming succinate--CoA ligase subunit beta [Acidimicrobiales bacterium]
MDLFEYQGKQYFARWGIPTSPGEVATTSQEVRQAAERIGYPAVVKAQVQVGGRGKAGGIRLVADAAAAEQAGSDILGMDIKGHVVHRVWVERATDIAEEWYASFTLDRSARRHLGMVSAKGGVEIEEVAATDPAAIARLHVDPSQGLSLSAAEALVAEARLSPKGRAQAAQLLVALYRCFVEGDADLVEINPLVLTTEGKVHALDAKVTLDDNAAFRHPEWQEMAAVAELDPREALARSRGLNYIGLDGTVGVIANGAGLAMSTLDVVSQAGGEAANFLDIGGGASAAVMTAALEVINADPKVGAILVNVFGGITRCDDVAAGIVEALSRVELRSPIVLRLDGTNATEGRAVLSEHASERLVVRPTMLEAARSAVEMAASRDGAGQGGREGASR